MNSDFTARLARISHNAPPPPDPEARAREEVRALTGGMLSDGLRLTLGFVLGLVVMVAVRIIMHHAETGDRGMAEVLWITRDLFGEIWLGMILSPTIARCLQLQSWSHLGASVLGAVVAYYGESALAMLFPDLLPVRDSTGPMLPFSGVMFGEAQL